MKPRSTLLALTALAASLVAGCGSAGPTTDLEGGALTPPGRATPGFEGPYAEEFARFYASAADDFVRAVLADEVITDAEYAEMTERFRSCLADVGITFNGFAPDGSFSTSVAPDGGGTGALVDACSTASGQDSIGLLHDVMGADPGNRDVDVAIAESLVTSGVVPPSYTAQDYQADRDGRFRDFEQLDARIAGPLDTCMRDPFGSAATS